MKQSLTSVIAICAIAGFTAPAFADCQEELAELRDQAQSEGDGGISKDGSMAPLEGGGDDASAADAEAETSDSTSAASQSDNAGDGNQIAKDGSQAPLDSDGSGVATSGQEAEAQQDGDAEPTEDSASGAMSGEAEDALARAEAALAAGDEAGCMDAVEEARNL